MAILYGCAGRLTAKTGGSSARTEGAEAAALEAKEASEAVMVEGREAAGKACLCSRPLSVQPSLRERSAISRLRSRRWQCPDQTGPGRSR